MIRVANSISVAAFSQESSQNAVTRLKNIDFDCRFFLLFWRNEWNATKRCDEENINAKDKKIQS